MDNKMTIDDRKVLIAALTYRYQELQSSQMNPIMAGISEQLRIVYPNLTLENSMDWACDLVSCLTKKETVEILNRIEITFSKK